GGGDWLPAGLWPGAGRVRLGGVRLQQHRLRDGDRAAVDRGAAGGVQVRRGGGTGRGAAGRVVRAAGADQYPGALEQAGGRMSTALEQDTPKGAVVPCSGFRVPRSADPWWVRWTLTAAALAVLTVLIVVPVVSVFAQALANGPRVYLDALLGDPDTRHAIGLTLVVAPTAVALNLVFGVAAAWLI